ncbi:glycine betaine ABC transporter substrate-binding protein [Marinilactibacillus sp. Marseille-P9653]|uniref:glycine betaine ABC transporter substrate-binding protein n=1 Tax=Marinilactibacillus sp. Marseille-P9653 TaxID=2866583 RepID=UPI001CE47404|nr:glycine betaine ABC transporter substrate-binding protein [Marinilactibacillus sp. Marseille-P9653]
MTSTWKKLGLTAASASALFLVACGNDSDSADSGSESKEINLAYVNWDSEVASTHVVGEVFKDLGYTTTLTPLDNAIMWEAVANDEADAMVAGWLPNTHASQFEQYGDDLDHIGTNLEGAKVGLVVPEYMDVNSIADLTDQADQTITGIEAGAGVMTATETALDTYENLSDWTLQPSSSGAMVTTLGQAYQNEEDFVVTGWSPHWKFQTYDLKYLDDPEGVFGDAETIDTFAREGLAEDMPEAHQVLENFNWTVEDMEAVMLEISEGVDPEEAARNWVDANQDTVDEWTAGVSEE